MWLLSVDVVISHLGLLSINSISTLTHHHVISNFQFFGQKQNSCSQKLGEKIILIFVLNYEYKFYPRKKRQVNLTAEFVKIITT